jgi:DNA-binding CsgD family transcriptional regulator
VEDFLAAIAQMTDCEAVLKMLAAEGRKNGFSVVAVGELPSGRTTRLSPFFYSTWPASWFEFYQAAQILGTDPIVETARQTAMPFSWDELELDPERWSLTPEDLRVFGLVKEYAKREGMNWTAGYGVPVFGPHSYNGLVSWAGSPRSFGSAARAGLHMKSLYAHDRMLRLHRQKFNTPELVISAYQLSVREFQILRGLITGKSDAAIAAGAGLSERTVQHYVTQAKKKLGCGTRSQLAAAAAKLGIT